MDFIIKSFTEKELFNMDVYEFSVKAASLYLKTSKVKSVKDIRQRFLPFCYGETNGHLVIPASELFDCSGLDLIANTLRFVDVTGIDKILAIFTHMITPEMVFMSFDVFKERLTLIHKGSLSLIALPIVEVNADKTMIQVRSVGLMEYISIMQPKTVYGLLLQVVQIVLFGFPIRHDTIEAMNFTSDISNYIRSRLFQGDVEYMQYDPKVNPNFHSMFLGMDQFTDQPKSELFHQFLVSKDNPELKAVLLQRIENMIETQHFLGQNSTYLQTLAEADLFSVTSPYKHYLQKQSRFKKVGFPVFKEVILNNKAPGGEFKLKSGFDIEKIKNSSITRF